ncbi:MAG: DNA-binding protein [Gammaproteobacteria bacterium]
MGKAILTQELVNEAADALVGEGIDPSIVNVKARIGAGSYTTVKKFLDRWKQEREAKNAAAPPTPPELEATGQEFTRRLWIQASTAAGEVAAAARAAAAAEIAAIRQDLNDARSEIARLEALEAEQAERLRHSEARLRKTELQLAEARTKAGRLDELETATQALKDELVAARQEAKEQALAAATKTGEIEALKTQVQQLLASIRPPDAAPGDRKARGK